MSTQNQFLITASMDGSDLGTFDKKTGGQSDSEEAKHRAGGMADQKALGGPKIVENLTISRLYDLTRDNALSKTIQSRIGRARCTITVQPLDADGNAYGAPDVYTGVLKSFKPPDVDSEGNDPAIFELEISTDGSIS